MAPGSDTGAQNGLLLSFLWKFNLKGDVAYKHPVIEDRID